MRRADNQLRPYAARFALNGGGDLANPASTQPHIELLGQGICVDPELALPLAMRIAQGLLHEPAANALAHRRRMHPQVFDLPGRCMGGQLHDPDKATVRLRHERWLGGNRLG